MRITCFSMVTNAFQHTESPWRTRCQFHLADIFNRTKDSGKEWRGDMGVEGGVKMQRNKNSQIYIFETFYFSFFLSFRF